MLASNLDTWYFHGLLVPTKTIAYSKSIKRPVNRYPYSLFRPAISAARFEIRTGVTDLRRGVDGHWGGRRDRTKLTKRGHATDLFFGGARDLIRSVMLIIIRRNVMSTTDRNSCEHEGCTKYKRIRYLVFG